MKKMAIDRGLMGSWNKQESRNIYNDVIYTGDLFRGWGGGTWEFLTSPLRFHRISEVYIENTECKSTGWNMLNTKPWSYYTLLYCIMREKYYS